jgi:hypothetical protein
MTGLPREFTFVFLVARPLKAKSSLKGKRHEIKHEKDNNTTDRLTHSAAHKCLDHAAAYTPIHIGIHVKPHISNIIMAFPVRENTKKPQSQMKPDKDWLSSILRTLIA